MTQEIICSNREGLLLCSDSLVVEERESGERRFHSFRKLYALGSHAAILSAGAKIGIDLSIRLAELISQRGVSDVGAVLPLAREFLDREYGRFVEEGRDWFMSHPDAYRRLYFVIGGYTQGDPDNPVQFYLLSSEDLELPFQVTATGTLLTMPRRLGFEMKLAGVLPQSSLSDLAGLCLSYLRQLGDKEPDRVGPPYYAATVSAEGFRWHADDGTMI